MTQTEKKSQTYEEIVEALKSRGFKKISQTEYNDLITSNKKKK